MTLGKNLFCFLPSFPETISLLMLSDCKLLPPGSPDNFQTVTPTAYGHLPLLSVALSPLDQQLPYSSHVNEDVLLTIVISLTTP